MVTEILLYSTIYSYSSAAFIGQLEQNKSNDIVIRMNTNGGNPEDAFGMVAKLAERATGTKSLITKIKVDGKAHSMGAFLLCYCSSAECLDVSEFLIHRAAYSQYYESDPDFMTPEMWANLDRINTKLRAAFEAKVDVNKFEQLKGVKLDDIFSNDKRLNVLLTAQEALSIGLVDSIVTITPEKEAEIKQEMFRIAAEATGYENLTLPQSQKIIQEPKPKKTMTIEQLKSEHPEVYAQTLTLGISQERDRVGAFLAFVEIDPQAVAKGIKEGENITQTLMAEMTMKALSGKKLEELKLDNPAAVATAETGLPASAEAKQIESFQAEVKKNLGVK